MKKTESFILIGFAYLLLSAAMPFSLAHAAQGPTPQNPLILTYEFWLSNKVGSWPYVESYFKKLEEITGGAVKMEYHTGGALGKPDEIYERTLRGVNNIGHFPPGYTPGVFPMFEMFELPIHFPTAETLTQAALAMNDKGYFKKDFSKVKLLSMYSNGPWVLYLAKDKVTTVEGLKGLKLNSASEGWVNVTKLLGGVPVSIFPAEHYSALQKGIMDGLWQLWDATLVYKMNEVCKYVNQVLFGTLMHVSAMNMDTWNKLPDAAKAYLESNFRTFSLEQSRRISRLDASRKAFLSTPGNEIYSFSKEEMAKLSQRLTPITTNWIAAREAKKLPAKQAIADLDQILRNRPDCRILGYTR
jgi:TRAP-type C4-dicarboxylate transport system substrate-binding protein